MSLIGPRPDPLDAMIKSGIQIGNGCIIAAGAVVTKNLPPYAIAGGIPAKIIRYRFTEEKIKEIEQLKWWDWSDKKWITECIVNMHISQIRKEMNPPQI